MGEWVVGGYFEELCDCEEMGMEESLFMFGDTFSALNISLCRDESIIPIR
jgi:hypothetical protein